MKNIAHTKSFLILMVLMAMASHGQKDEPDPNLLYENYAEAYLNMDATLVGQLYVKDAVLLNLYDSSNPNSISGNDQIETYFSDFFERCRKNGQTLGLTFKITDRKELEETILDNGYYKLTIRSADAPEVLSHGKLSTILKLDNGSWKFLVDANTNTDEIEYKNAKTDSIRQPR